MVVFSNINGIFNPFEEQTTKKKINIHYYWIKWYNTNQYLMDCLHLRKEDEKFRNFLELIQEKID